MPRYKDSPEVRAAKQERREKCNCLSKIYWCFHPDHNDTSDRNPRLQSVFLAFQVLQYLPFFYNTPNQQHCNARMGRKKERDCFCSKYKDSVPP